MNELKIGTTDGRTSLEPGEQIEVVAEWQLDERPSAVELRLVWYTQGKGDEDVQIVDSTRFDAPAVFESRRWTVQLPNGPYSFSGKLISLIWALELVVEPSEESRRLDLIVAPHGQEVVLHRDFAAT